MKIISNVTKNVLLQQEKIIFDFFRKMLHSNKLPTRIDTTVFGVMRKKDEH